MLKDIPIPDGKSKLDPTSQPFTPGIEYDELKSPISLGGGECHHHVAWLLAYYSAHANVNLMGYNPDWVLDLLRFWLQYYAKCLM